MNKSAFVVAALTGWLLVGAAVAAPQFVQGPGARYAHAMAYDSARQVVVLFGGNSNGYWPGGALGDTWEWNGSTWTERTPANSPSPRGHGAMVYDSARGVCVFYGGTAVSSSNPGFAETWEWDGIQWTQRTSVGTAGPRYHHSMVYDSLRHVIVLFGGFSSGSSLQDTWEYDGNTWTNRNVQGPSARWNVDLAYRSITGQTVLFGGTTLSARLDDTWIWDGTNWTELTGSVQRTV